MRGTLCPRRPYERPPARRCHAQSLVAALIVLAFVTSLFGAMSMALMAEARLAADHGARLAAFYLARAGAEAAMREIKADDPAVDALADSWSDNPEAFDGTPLGEGVFHVRHRRPEDGAFVFGAVDEERKVNVNTASGAMLARLDPAFTLEAVYAVLNHRIRGRFRTLSELEALGILPLGTLDRPLPGKRGTLRDFLTVFGDGRVNVNTASPTVLDCLPGVSPAMAEAFAAWREESGEALADAEEAALRLEVAPGQREEFLRRVRTSSEHFTVLASGRLLRDPALAAKIRQVVRRGPEGLVVLEFEQLR